MTTIKTISSSSSGNGYIIESGRQTLILELGLQMADYVSNIKDFTSVCGCVATHCHTDHLNKSTAKEFIRRGVRVYMGEEVLKECEIEGIEPLKSHFRNRAGGFTVQTFPAPHNVPNCGFLIETPTAERIVFVTDTTGVNLRFRNIHCIMCECNYDEDTLLDNMMNHEEWHGHPENHMSLEQCCLFCKANIGMATQRVLLLHSSLGNLNQTKALEILKRELCFNNIEFATAGSKVIIDNLDF